MYLRILSQLAVRCNKCGLRMTDFPRHLKDALFRLSILMGFEELTAVFLVVSEEKDRRKLRQWMYLVCKIQGREEGKYSGA